MSESMAPPNATHITLSDIPFNMAPDTSNAIPKFNGNPQQSLKFWLNSHFEPQAVTGNWTDSTRRAVAISKLEGVAQSWHQSQGALYPSWADWLAALKIQFGHDLKLFDWMDLCNKCVQREDETCVAYYLRKQPIIEQSPRDIEGPFPWTERLDLVVKGLLSEFRNVVISANPCDFAAMMKLLKDLDANDPKKESKHNSLTKANVDDSKLNSAASPTKNKQGKGGKGKGGKGGRFRKNFPANKDGKPSAKPSSAKKDTWPCGLCKIEHPVGPNTCPHPDRKNKTSTSTKAPFQNKGSKTKGRDTTNVATEGGNEDEDPGIDVTNCQTDESPSS